MKSHYHKSQEHQIKIGKALENAKHIVEKANLHYINIFKSYLFSPNNFKSTFNYHKKLLSISKTRLI